MSLFYIFNLTVALPGGEVDTALYILDGRGKLVTFTEQKDGKGVSSLYFSGMCDFVCK